ncbi:hypothetical protein [Stappia sp. ES.058]|uniref:hypothetical protein n=1 Tax=Stappia sp. ES.058 TaxID=1881061 RepID=UPI00087BD3D7|nr:hypothetical protein [Stappia sp. ES.058]SDU07440.1 hypothetical protein SAMN05428979_1479 [Stappia sp. ES.058]
MPIERKCKKALFAVVAALVLTAPASAVAGEADVVTVETRQAGDGSWRFAVAVAHADEGWDHYADLWEIVAPDGTVLGQRVLAHPHVDEQPFTRFLSGVVIPAGTAQVVVRARDNVHGPGGRTVTVVLD